MSGKRNFGLDVLRSHGCIMIVVLAHGALLFYHLHSDFRALWYVGSIGMDMFFVLSGFLIGGILLDTIPSGPGWVRRFWLRRWIRTLPNYYLFLVINIVLWWYTYGSVSGWPSFLVFGQNLAWQQSPLFPESWSLALEEVFYLVAPLVFMLFALDGRRPQRTLAVWGAIIVLGIGGRYAWVIANDPSWDEGVKKVVAARADAIAWGLFAVQWVRWARPSATRMAWMAAAGIALVLVTAAAYLASDENTSVFARVAPFALDGLAFALMMPWFASLDGSRMPSWYRLVANRLAVWSYSWYVIHLVVMRIIDLLVPGHYGWALTTCKYLVYVGASLAWSWANYEYFEKPILRWRDRIVGGSEFRVLPEATPADRAQGAPISMQPARATD